MHRLIALVVSGFLGVSSVVFADDFGFEAFLAATSDTTVSTSVMERDGTEKQGVLVALSTLISPTEERRESGATGAPLRAMVAPVAASASTRIALRPMVTPPPHSHPVQLVHMDPKRPAPTARLIAMEPKGPTQLATLRPMDTRPPDMPARLIAMEPKGPTQLATLRPLDNRKLASAPAPLQRMIAMGPLPNTSRASIAVNGWATSAAVGSGLVRADMLGARTGGEPGTLAGLATPLVTEATLGGPSATQLANVGAMGTGEDDEMFLDLSVNGQEILASLVAYRAAEAGQIWLPLRDIAKAMEFNITVDVANGRANGWFLREDNTFSLDINTGRVTVAGVDKPYNPSMVRRYGNDIYVHSAAFSPWFGALMRVDYGELRLYAQTDTPLPSMLRAARERAWGAMDAQRQRELAGLIKDATVLPYSWISAPRISLNTSMDYSNAARGGLGSSVGLSAEGDLLKTTGSLNLSASRDARTDTLRFDTIRLNLRRDEMQPTLLGPLNATSLQAGDINGTDVALSRVGSSGRGFRFHNRPMGFVDNTNKLVLTGDAPSGWDVEIYQNETLMAFQRIGADGVYRFESIPLRTGVNTFRIVQYGPQGQQRERKETYTFGDSMVAQGELLYDTAIVQAGHSLFPTTKDTRPEPWMLTSRFDYGVLKNLAATLALQTPAGGTFGTISSSQSQGIGAGLRATAGPVYAQTDIYRNAANEQALAATARMRFLFDTDLSLGYEQRTGYSSLDAPIVRSYAAGLGRAFTFGKTSLNTNLGLRNSMMANGDTRQDINQSLGFNLSGWAFSNALSTAVNTAGRTPVRGTFQASSYNLLNSGLALRGDLGYTLGDDQQLLQQGSIGARATLANNVTVDTSLRRTLGLQPLTELQGSLRYNMGPFSVGMQGSGNDSGGYQVGMNMATMLMPTAGGDYNAINPAAGSNMGDGRANIRVFLDANRNNTFDEGERLLAGVSVMNRGRGSSHPTDANGLATVDSLPSFTPVKIELEEDTLPDIYLRPSKPYIAVISHPGAVATLDMPVQLFGEVTGLITHAKNMTLKLNGAVLEVVDAQGRVASATKIKADGEYGFSPLAMGTYTLRIRPPKDTVWPATLQGTRATFTLTDANNVADNVNLHLTPGR